MKPQSHDIRTADAAFRNYLRLQVKYDKAIKAILEQAARDLVGIMLQIPDDTFSKRIRLAQYQLRLQEVERTLRHLWNSNLSQIEARMRKASDLAAQGVSELNKMLLGVGRRAGVDAQLLQGFEAASRQGIANVQSRLINNIDLSPRVYKNAALSTGQVNNVVNTGIVGNQSAKEIAQRVRQFVSARAPGGVSFSAMRLGRTELNNAFHTTQTMSYAEQPWVNGVKWVTSGSHPRPDVCDAYANEDHDDLGAGVFRPGNVPGKPHPMCLCHIQPITIDREEFIDRLVSGKYDRYISARIG